MLENFHGHNNNWNECEGNADSILPSVACLLSIVQMGWWPTHQLLIEAVQSQGLRGPFCTDFNVPEFQQLSWFLSNIFTMCTVGTLTPRISGLLPGSLSRIGLFQGVCKIRSPQCQKCWLYPGKEYIPPPASSCCIQAVGICSLVRQSLMAASWNYISQDSIHSTSKSKALR